MTNTIIANLRHAARNHETVSIGGGDFGPAELLAVALTLESQADLLAALQKIDANAAESPEWIRRVASEAIDQAIAAAHKNTSHPGAQVPQSASGEQCQDAEAKLRRLEATNKQLQAALEFALRDMQGVREMYASKSSRVGVLAVSIGLVSAAIAKDNEDQA